MKTESILELEVDNDFDRHFFFSPVGSALRGRCDFGRMAPHNPNAIMLTPHFPKGVPGQRIRVDLASGDCAILDPLVAEPAWEGERKELLKRNLPLPTQALETHHPANIADWLWAIQRGLRDGFVKIVAGAMPKDLGTETPRQETLDPGEQRIERLCDLIERLLGGLVPQAAGSR